MSKAKLQGDERRKNRSPTGRRPSWTLWYRVAVLMLLASLGGGTGGFVLGTGIPADALAAAEQNRAEQLEAVNDALTRQLAGLQEAVDARPQVVEREVRVPYPVVETVYKDTLYLPGPAPEPQIVEVQVPGPAVPGPVRIMEIPTPQPAGVCFDTHSFTSSHTFRPGLGQISYLGAGLLLGLLLTVEATAQAEVYVQ